MKTLKNITEQQWGWIAAQALFSLLLCFNSYGWVLAILANGAVLFVIFAAREVWPENK